MKEYEFYSVEKKPPIAWVYLNRPDKKNAMNPPAWRETIPIFDDLDSDLEIRVVIIAGKGPCFSSGIDLVSMVSEVPEILNDDQKGGVKWSLLSKIYKMQDAISCVEWCKK
ncbi:MAG: enoyl-CoA hydratase-related protein, partial [Thermodesulfobacteriota bacterium]|nr:enoyl-CoA hydratase-related protein [Thermodesulfobacteriota bacterium]